MLGQWGRDANDEDENPQGYNSAPRILRPLDADNPMITEEEAALLLGVSERSMRRLRSRRKVSYFRVLRRIMYRHSDLQDFLSKYRVVAREK